MPNPRDCFEDCFEASRISRHDLSHLRDIRTALEFDFTKAGKFDPELMRRLLDLRKSVHAAQTKASQKFKALLNYEEEQDELVFLGTLQSSQCSMVRGEKRVRLEAFRLASPLRSYGPRCKERHEGILKSFCAELVDGSADLKWIIRKLSGVTLYQGSKRLCGASELHTLTLENIIEDLKQKVAAIGKSMQRGLLADHALEECIECMIRRR